MADNSSPDRTAENRLSRRSLAVACLLAPVALAGPGVAASRTIELAIEKRRVSVPQSPGDGRSPPTVRVTQGDAVEIVWTSDETATLHLHGYNIETVVAPGAKASMRFQARAAGRFAVETHAIGNDKKRHLTLIYIEVHPR